MESSVRPPARPERSLSRRNFLIGTGSLLLLTGCTTAGPAPVPTPQVKSVDQLVGGKPFYVAHRGSGDNWVEHTMDAYAQSTAAGATAIEVSVRATSDGQLICHHDANLERTTGVNKVIADETWETLSSIKNNARAWLGPNSDEQPIVLLKDVLDRFAANGIIFIEDKDGTNTTKLLDLMDSYPNSNSHFVWKQWAGSKTGQAAADRGYKRWGYFTVDLLPQSDAIASGFDYLGVNAGFTDDQMKKIVNYGKPVICWEVHFRSQRTHLEKLGINGMMCSNFPYVTGTTAISTTDSFDTGLRATGDLPWKADVGWGLQPHINADASSLTMSGPMRSYLMGSMSPVEKTEYRLSMDMRWPREGPGGSQHGGLAFGADGDSSYVVGTASESFGYHVVLRGGGSFELYSREAGNASGTLLGSVQTTVPRAGQWITINVTMAEGRLTAARSDDISWVITVDLVGTHGGYMWLLKNYNAGPDIEFRNIAILDKLA